MPLSTAAKAALCLCPPAVMAGTVVAVPAAKRAVHHLAAPHHVGKPVRRLATAAAQLGAQAERSADCDPASSGALPALPLVTYAAPIPDEPAGPSATGGSFGPVVGTLAVPSAVIAASPASGIAPSPGVTPTPGAGGTTPVTSAVPEPASWTMMIVGIGLVGVAWRRRRRNRAWSPMTNAERPAGAGLWVASAALETTDVAAATAAKSTMAAVAGKALLCVCPAALVAGSVVAIPPLRHALHASTASPAMIAPSISGGVRAIVPCDQATTTPVAAMSVKGFPNVVNTVSPAAQIALVRQSPGVMLFSAKTVWDN